ncbi:hypothetical protein SAICODRAFT_19198 [Saitoella complicata NRRL Y-17804]|uniref:uncharacterized protein n=1 Tax=Saitoella complicata (strain BCRC 22490 / CBS 7301 / JCM 7358 / NBRC 10748 / NRRL Y-17804) TaxID=698492 RepID=UPI000867FD6D|nr:uncharacterized protein SAICODRAFT_19198 [Saitoella complicata NRRL Y-17804]ODQ53283.1 hypothetical protein SAICODRAFT_19198 [Saitoella complicata NRRL Y-17804]
MADVDIQMIDGHSHGTNGGPNIHTESSKDVHLFSILGRSVYYYNQYYEARRKRHTIDAEYLKARQFFNMNPRIKDMMDAQVAAARKEEDDRKMKFEAAAAEDGNRLKQLYMPRDEVARCVEENVSRRVKNELQALREEIRQSEERIMKRAKTEVGATVRVPEATKREMEASTRRIKQEIGTLREKVDDHATQLTNLRTQTQNQSQNQTQKPVLVEVDISKLEEQVIQYKETFARVSEHLQAHKSGIEACQNAITQTHSYLTDLDSRCQARDELIGEQLDAVLEEIDKNAKTNLTAISTLEEKTSTAAGAIPAPANDKIWAKLAEVEAKLREVEAQKNDKILAKLAEVDTYSNQLKTLKTHMASHTIALRNVEARTTGTNLERERVAQLVQEFMSSQQGSMLFAQVIPHAVATHLPHCLGFTTIVNRLMVVEKRFSDTEQRLVPLGPEIVTWQKFRASTHTWINGVNRRLEILDGQCEDLRKIIRRNSAGPAGVGAGVQSRPAQTTPTPAPVGVQRQIPARASVPRASPGVVPGQVPRQVPPPAAAASAAQASQPQPARFVQASQTTQTAESPRPQVSLAPRLQAAQAPQAAAAVPMVKKESGVGNKDNNT